MDDQVQSDIRSVYDVGDTEDLVEGQDLIISVAVNGGESGPAASPYLPVDVADIVREIEAASLAGAAIAHVHVRAPDGAPSHAPELYQRLLGGVRERCDVIVNMTLDPGVPTTHEERVAPLALRPEMATLGMGSMSLDDHMMEAPISEVRWLASELEKSGTVPEIGIFHSGMLRTCRRLHRAGELRFPLFLQLVLGAPGGAPATVRELVNLVEDIPDDAIWSVLGVGAASVPMALAGIALGGHVRVGLEDQFYYDAGRLARSNAELVDRVARIAHEAGRPVASAARAREILGLGAATPTGTD